jgi:hypothetical protein
MNKQMPVHKIQYKQIESKKPIEEKQSKISREKNYRKKEDKENECRQEWPRCRRKTKKKINRERMKKKKMK